MEVHIARHKAADAATVSRQVLDHIAATLDKHKAEDVVIIDLQGKSDIADYMVIASGRSARHVSTLADYIAETLRNSGHPDILVEGKETGDWVLVDSFHVITHLFRPEIREFYNLEKMWAVPLPEEAAFAGSVA